MWKDGGRDRQQREREREAKRTLYIMVVGEITEEFLNVHMDDAVEQNKSHETVHELDTGAASSCQLSSP